MDSKSGGRVQGKAMKQISQNVDNIRDTEIQLKKEKKRNINATSQSHRLYICKRSIHLSYFMLSIF